MNAKRYKRIRLTLRANNVPVREAHYVHHEHRINRPPYISLQTLLDDACGRIHYKRAKKAVRA